MKKLKYILLAMALTTGLLSCDINKRKYMPGYYIGKSCVQDNFKKQMLGGSDEQKDIVQHKMSECKSETIELHLCQAEFVSTKMAATHNVNRSEIKQKYNKNIILQNTSQNSINNEKTKNAINKKLHNPWIQRLIATIGYAGFVMCFLGFLLLFSPENLLTAILLLLIGGALLSIAFFLSYRTRGN